jgi:hypothetical protein
MLLFGLNYWMLFMVVVVMLRLRCCVLFPCPWLVGIHICVCFRFVDAWLDVHAAAFLFHDRHIAF